MNQRSDDQRDIVLKMPADHLKAIADELKKLNIEHERTAPDTKRPRPDVAGVGARDLARR